MPDPDEHDDPAGPLVARLRAAGCVFAEEEADVLLAAASGDALEGMVRRRVAGEPLEHVVGRVEFAGLRLSVGPGVFVPRRRTELMVSVALSVLDRVPDVEVVASDLDPGATAHAAVNLRTHAAARVVTGDLFAAVPAPWRGTVDVVVANAPYVPSRHLATMPAEAREHEPRAALDGGVDGLDLHRRIAAAVGAWLRPGGVLVVEVSTDQTDAALELVTAAGLRAGLVRDDEADATVVTARAGLGEGP